MSRVIKVKFNGSNLKSSENCFQSTRGSSFDVQVAWVEVREIDVGLSQWRVNGREVSK